MSEITDSVVRFHRRYAMAGMAVLLLFVLVLAALTHNQIRLQMAHEEQMLAESFNETVAHLDSLLAAVTIRVEGLKASAEADLTEQAGGSVVAQGFASLAPTAIPELYALDAPKPPLVKERIGNLTGRGQLNGRSESFHREINMALRLSPQFHAVATSLKDIAWVYYTSKEHFLNIYPWVASNQFRFSPELYKHGFYLGGLPENNPQRQLFWTEVYVDEYGKGLMTTCAAPVYDRDRFTGTVAIDLTVDFLNTVVAGFHAKQGTMFLVNDRQELVGHPRLITSSDKQTKTIGDAMPWLDGPGQARLNERSCQARVDFADMSVFKGCLTRAPWHVYFAMPRESLWSSLTRYLGIGQLAMLLGIPVLLALFFVLTNRCFVRPSQQFARFIVDRDPGQRAITLAGVPRFWRPWFAAVAQTFAENDALAAEIQRKQEELEVRVQVRTEELAAANQRLEGEIRERAQAQQLLRESEKRYRRIFHCSIDVYLELDLEGRILEASPAIEKLLLHRREELIGQPLPALHADAHTISHLLQAVKDTGWLADADVTLQDRDHAAVACSLTLMLLDADRGQGAKIIGSLHDNRERIRMEREKQELEARLQRAEKMEMLGTLAGGVAHDLNNILSGLVGYPDLLLMRLDTTSPLRGPLEKIRKSGEKAAAVVGDMLALARRGVMVRETMDLNRVIEDCFDSPEWTMLQAATPDIRLTRQLSGDLLPISGSPAHLSKVIMNLVRNGVEAITGAGTIVVSTESSYVDRPIRGYDKVEEGDYAVVRISDNGQGIGPEDMDKIFEPFYTKKKMGRSGTGLGMAVVWGTVKDHQGYIDVASAPGQGTTISLYFPTVRGEDAAAAEEAGPLRARGGKESILVVDDVQEQRDLAAMLLTELGYEVAVVASGEEAVAWLRDRPVDLVVLDMIMDPGIDGLETYRQIVRLHPRQKAIITSGYAETDRVHEAQRLGAGAYVNKPYLLQTLGQAVRAELDRRAI